LKISQGELPIGKALFNLEVRGAKLGVYAEAGVWRSVPSNDTETLALTVQVKERGREQLASLRTEAAMSGKWAAILSASGWGSKVVLEAKNLRTAWGSEGGDFVKTSPNATATEEAEAVPFI